MSLKYILLSAYLLIQATGFSQKQTTHTEQVWLAYFNQTRISNKFGIWADFHLRTRGRVFHKFLYRDCETGVDILP